MHLWALFFIAAGIFSVCGGVFNWDWYMNLRKARTMVDLFGRNGARGFYIVLGGILVVFGVLAMTGVIDMSR